MDERKEPADATNTDEKPIEDVSPTDAEQAAEAEAQAEGEAEAETEANLMAKIEMNVFGHP